MKDINIAKTLCLKRKEKKITQEDLAAYIGVSKASVSKWETGQSYPDITFLPQLAAYFNISIDELIGYSPQMTKADIKKLYHRLSAAFATQPYEVVLAECKQIIKKYYACFPLLLQVCILLMNHHMLAKDKDEQQDILHAVIGVCLRIKEESDDVFMSRQANSLEATCLLMLGRAQEILELFDDTLHFNINDDLLLANAYLALGEADEAKRVLQISIYNYVLTSISNCTLLLHACGNNPEQFQEISRRTHELINLFEVAKLNPNPVLIFYLTIAQSYCDQGEPDLALDALEDYGRICLEIDFPLRLHGDQFFDSIDAWFADFDLGVHPPRDQSLIKASLITSITDNPAFANLSDLPRFTSIVNRLQTKLGGS